MNEITIKRGGRKVTFKKTPEYFAVRTKQGRAASVKTLEACCGQPQAPVRHVESVATANMEVFAVEETDKLEETMDQLREAPASDVVSHVYSIDNTPSGAVIPTGTMTIQFKPDVSPQKCEEILAKYGLEIIEDLDFLPHGHTVRLTQASTKNPLKIAAELQQLPEIETAEPDLSFQVSLKYIPADPLYPEQWHLHNRGDKTGLAAGADVKAEGAWEYTLGSRDIVVSIIDDGFDLTHPEFSAPGKIVAPRDFSQNDLDPAPMMEGENHGTACAGVAIAEENGIGGVGLAPRCAFMPVRMAQWLTDQSVMQMFQYIIDNNADVVSCSWSAGAWNFPLSTKMSGIIRKAATQGRRNKKGCVILFAAGNEGRPLNGEKDGQVSYQGFALHPDVIAVAASNSLDKHSSYSNYGPEITLCAPSSGTPGRRITTTDRRGTKGYSAEDYTHDFGGTSSATPLAAGLAALILSVNPDLTAAEVKQIMMDTADKIDEENGEYVDGHSPYFGHGRINAEKAVALAAGASQALRLPQVLFVEHRVNKPIPDPGEVEDPITFPLDVPIRDIEVSVDIRHTWRGDLKLILKAPQGREIILRDRSGGSQDDLIASFRSSTEPALFAPLIGKSAEGDWRLHIVDTNKRDAGVLLKWGLAITY
ncbi:MAG: S8 family serine peptidase [Chloroflexi bacterium]|jgi:subtilisin family serine protease|nr:S8 family serine peptidase [Chloroflexota bacterium]